MLTRCKKCGRRKLLGRGWVSQSGKYWYCPDCWNDVLSQRKTHQQPTAESVAEKPKKSQAAGTRALARKLIKEIIHTVDLSEGSYERRQEKLNRLATLGSQAIPLITQAIDSVITESHATHEFKYAGELCSVIGRIKGNSAFDLLMKYFNFETNIWEYELIRAGAACGLGYLGDDRAIVHLTRTLQKSAKTEEVYSAIEESLKRLGSKPPLTVDTLVKNFTELELVKQEPDFQGFSVSLKQFAKAQRAAAWWKLGWVMKNRGDDEKAQKCFVKALTINASRNFAAWDSLRPPIEWDKRNSQTLKRLQQEIGVIVDD